MKLEDIKIEEMNEKTLFEVNFEKYRTENFKSSIIIGNRTFNCTKKFNWLNRKMMKIVFGFEVENMEEEK